METLLDRPIYSLYVPGSTSIRSPSLLADTALVMVLKVPVGLTTRSVAEMDVVITAKAIDKENERFIGWCFLEGEVFIVRSSIRTSRWCHHRCG